jgi:acyl-CoA synthetase (AMP-forming)/AMP-acid ligase II
MQAQDGVPPELSTLGQLIGWRVARHPDRLPLNVLRHGQPACGPWTYAELRRRVRALASELVRRELSRQRVAVLCQPSPDDWLSILACQLANAVPVPLAPPRGGRNRESSTPS